ncbi:tetratricopeptide repeat protein [uncultured Helicobacter sp.]|uniref:tetratricopeptide repeat protein n=1 Tax=uncultured Helicobacter sp. TaxID=175537 RepID=UPI00262F5E29|nr:tetratricopeptide repeat protein [uncultured Helicobacter sp.]
MKKLVVILCMLGVLFGGEKSLAKQGYEALKEGEYQKAMEIYQRVCDSGEAWGCGILGAIYDNGIISIVNGIGVKKVKEDKAKAVELYAQACNSGDFLRCTILGVMYDKGDGVKQDKTKAIEFYAKACDAGNDLECLELGVMYDKGEGVWHNKFKAEEFYDKACYLRNEEGCKNYVRLNVGTKRF